MKEYPNQSNPTSPEDALEKAIKKWLFFSTCSRKDMFGKYMNSSCGLCKWYNSIERQAVTCCKGCPLDKTVTCKRTGLIYQLFKMREGPKFLMKDFHAKAREVYNTLKGYRN